MTATVQIRRWIGPAIDPQIIETTSNTNNSYWVATRLFVSAAPTGVIDNIRWYINGASLGACISAKANIAVAYIKATGDNRTSSDEINTANIYNLHRTPVDVLSSYPNATTALGDFVVYRITIDSTASPAASLATFTWLYDET